MLHSPVNRAGTGDLGCPATLAHSTQGDWFLCSGLSSAWLDSHSMLTGIADSGSWLMKPFVLICLPRSSMKGVKPKDGHYSSWPVRQRIMTAVWVN